MFTSIALSLILLSPAQSADDTWVVVSDVDDKIPGDWSAAFIAAAGREVSLGKTPQASRGDLMVALGCSKWTKKCAKQVADILKADVVISLETRSSGSGAKLKYDVTTKKGKRLRANTFELPDRRKFGRLLVEAAATEAAGGSKLAALVVETDLPGASVTIDGNKVGTTPLMLTDLKPGEVSVLLEKAGMAAVRTTATVVAGKVVTMEKVNLKAGASAPNGQTSGGQSNGDSSSGGETGAGSAGGDSTDSATTTEPSGNSGTGATSGGGTNDGAVSNGGGETNWAAIGLIAGGVALVATSISVYSVVLILVATTPGNVLNDCNSKGLFLWGDAGCDGGSNPEFASNPLSGAIPDPLVWNLIYNVALFGGIAGLLGGGAMAVTGGVLLFGSGEE